MFTTTQLHGFNKTVKQRSSVVPFSYNWSADPNNYGSFPVFNFFDMYIEGEPRPDRCVLAGIFTRFPVTSPGVNVYATYPDLYSGNPAFNGEPYKFGIYSTEVLISGPTLSVGIALIRLPYTNSSTIVGVHSEWNSVTQRLVTDLSLPINFIALNMITLNNVMSTDYAYDSIAGYDGNNSGVSTSTINMRAGSSLAVFSSAIGNAPSEPDWSVLTQSGKTDSIFYDFVNSDYDSSFTDGSTEYSTSMAFVTFREDVDNVVFSPTWSGNPNQVTICKQII